MSSRSITNLSSSLSVYEQLKLNVGCSALGRYRSPNEVFRDRRLRISAAARAQLKAKRLVQRRTSSSLQIAETPVTVLSTPSLPESPVAGKFWNNPSADKFLLEWHFP